MKKTAEPSQYFWLSKIAIKKPTSVFIVMILIIFIGFSAYRTLPREASPEVQIPYLIVTVPYPGSAPEDVESLIIDKMETEMQNVEGLKEMSSTSTEGAGMIALEYFLGTNIDEAKTEVREVLDRLKPDLPDEAEDAIITEINTADFPILTLNLSGKAGLLRLKEVAEEIKEDIEAVPGILEVKRAGGLEREVQVNVDPDKLRYYNLDLNQVANTIAYENTNIPAGDITVGPLKYQIRIPGEINEPTDIEEMVITAPNQIPIFTRDVAEIKFGFKEVTSRSRLYEVESVSLSISKRSGENLLEITEKIKKIIHTYQAKYQGLVSFTILSDHSDFVKKFVRDLENNIYSGLASVLIVLLLILGLRNSLFVAAAIPFSMLISFLVIQSLGITLNMIVLFGLIMALGMLVDNAIVVVENIYRHLESGLPPKEAALIGVSEVAIPVITST
ncbi:MAG: efflux RND transporter permease subunit, partial [SAR324 cluster bacterium]|nr:efflux RND transporter permease subunit [SAR324 cluster bacterium]